MQRLSIPWVSQLSEFARSSYDCGQAGVSMIVQWLTGQFITPDAISMRVSGRTGARQLANLIREYAPNARVAVGQGASEVAERAVHVGATGLFLVDYKRLNLPQHLISGNDQGPHWVVLAGADEEHVIIHDPLWTSQQRNGQGGAYLTIPRSTFDRAYLGSTVIVRPDNRAAPASHSSSTQVPASKSSKKEINNGARRQDDRSGSEPNTRTKPDGRSGITAARPAGKYGVPKPAGNTKSIATPRKGR